MQSRKLSKEYYPLAGRLLVAVAEIFSEYSFAKDSAVNERGEGQSEETKENLQVGSFLKILGNLLCCSLSPLFSCAYMDVDLLFFWSTAMEDVVVLCLFIRLPLAIERRPR